MGKQIRSQYKLRQVPEWQKSLRKRISPDDKARTLHVVPCDAQVEQSIALETR